ncbi:DNA alkylation repair protein [Rhabdochlamydiaceae symbiont of Dictyostelium giganteum]|uniref:DNA alkylation repair protein n=1 Tax=Rhabdochlamydiaceae symbiont of Dictyostelium giganteum TaxID=3342349 RepID=UPI00384BFF49
MTETIKRKGYACIKKIPADILEDLSRGKIETASLTEALAIDFSLLLQETFPQLFAQKSHEIQNIHSLSFMMRTKFAAALLYEHYGLKIIDELILHPSDSVRGWAAGVISLNPNLSLEERLEQIKPLARDPHFGVREMAWLLLRDHIAEDIATTITLLTPWVQDVNPYIRRFAVESTRPRGVWCSHIADLKNNPSLGLPLLEPLSQDPEKYVQDSVANWLNDAGKTNREFVLTLTQEWLKNSSHKATTYICKRACRNLLK